MDNHNNDLCIGKIYDTQLLSHMHKGFARVCKALVLSPAQTPRACFSYIYLLDESLNPSQIYSIGKHQVVGLEVGHMTV